MKPHRLATLLYYSSWLCLLALPALLVGLTYAYGPFPQLGGIAPLPAPFEFATGWHIWSAYILGLFPNLLLIWAIYQMRGLFGLYRRGEVLTRPAALHIRQIGFALTGIGILPLLVRPLQTVLLTMANPPGSRSISFAISSSDLGYLLGGGLMILIGWAMLQAAEVAEENRAFV